LQINLFSEEMRRNPFPVYSQVRSASPVLNVPAQSLWMIFDYDGVKRALNDHDAFSSDMSTAGRVAPDWLVFLDPPRHTKLRSLIMSAFTPRVVANLEPRIRELSRELLDGTIERGEMDMAADYAVPLPVMVIAELIGIPAADWSRFRRWSDAILTLSFTVPGGQKPMAPPAEYYEMRADMQAYVPGLIAQKRSAPKDDLLTRLVQAQVDGQHLTEQEIIAFIQLLLVAGQETTANLINNTVLTLAENPDQLAVLKSSPDLLPSAIEEVLRYRSPFQWTLRATRRDIDMGGQVIPAGKLVLAVIGSANRDPSQFRDPDRFDITRDQNPHVAFGHGIHFCIGAALSRLEGRVALSEFLNRISGLQLASEKPWEPRAALHVYGPTRLPVRFQVERHAVQS